jgi:hypothetical protein
MRHLDKHRAGQSIAEYVVVLALVAILVATLIAGVGRRSQNRVDQANDALDEASVASGTTSSKSGKPAVAGVGSRPTVRPPENR